MVHRMNGCPKWLSRRWLSKAVRTSGWPISRRRSSQKATKSRKPRKIWSNATQNLRTTFRKIIERAGLQPWPKLFQNLRSTRETELSNEFPLHVVTAWIGNSQLVAAQHYLQVTDQHFSDATHSKVGHIVGQKASETTRNEQPSTQATREKRSVFRGSAGDFADMQSAGLGPTGLEPVTSRM